MNKRLQMLMKALNLTAAQFADQIGVQRSSISHVLSGRNKPSMDFTEKILKRFPQVNAEWLITGAGAMMKGSDLFSSEYKAAVEKSSTSSRINTDQKESGTEISKEVEKKSPKAIQKSVSGGDELNRAERIVLFFRDGTFLEYFNSDS